jgi:hypothetical protein
VQVAISILLLAGAGLFLRTIYNLERVRLGFNQERLLVFTMQPRQAGYRDERLLDFYRRLSERLDALPGVSRGDVRRRPHDRRLHVEHVAPPARRDAADRRGAHDEPADGPRELLRGPRDPQGARTRLHRAGRRARAPRWPIVNQAFARAYFPGTRPAGQRVRTVRRGPEIEIVGVVGDTKYDSQRKAVEPLLFTPWRQRVSDVGEVRVRASAPRASPSRSADTVRRIVRELDPNLPVTESRHAGGALQRQTSPASGSTRGS